MYRRFEKIIFTLYAYVLAKILLNTAKFIQKLTPGLKNLMRNLNNFSQAVESTKTWNLMGFCPKHTFLQLKHYIQRIYLSLMWSNCVKIHQITFVILETISHFSQLLCIFLVHYVFSTKVAHQSANFQTFHCSGQSSPIFSCHFSNKKSVFLQSLDLFSVSWEIILLYFLGWNFICYWQK